LSRAPSNIRHSCLLGGLGVPIDLISAARYFKLSAGQNDVSGRLKYGFCLLNGVRIDFPQAARDFKLPLIAKLFRKKVLWAIALNLESVLIGM
jgi:TPR repeat protein